MAKIYGNSDFLTCHVSLEILEAIVGRFKFCFVCFVLLGD